MRRRLLGPLIAALALTGLLTAGVVAPPDAPGGAEPAGDRARGGPLALLRERPVDHDPQFERFEAPPTATPATPEQPAAPAPPLEPLDSLAPDRPGGPSRSIGRPWRGRLENGVELPPQGVAFFTFDSAARVSPSRRWRRWATASTVARTLAVLNDFHAAHPAAPRLGVGDLSRPRGGAFGREYGGLGHRSHQNGQDVDVYYPRRDRRELPPRTPSQVDRRLAQDLVDRFVAAGAEMVFVGPSLNLRGPRGVVSELVHHDDHLHVRWPK